ncbi:MAG: TonB-dependent receptor plug domain-containing protein, partial [Gemmatimonadetes bacterium]|nr:TonB-dependent receptor plug domain-containing protein [Gemmatimonadota bacterium]
MKKKGTMLGAAVALWSAAILTASPVSAQAGAIRGRVVDGETAAPLSAIVVELAGTEHRAVSGRHGTFALSGVAPGAYELIARASGYGETTQSVRVEPGETLMVAVRVETTVDHVAYRLDPITVTAARSARPGSRVAGSVSVVRSEEIGLRVAQSVDDVVGDLPNVTTIGGPRSQAELPQIRGLGADRVIFRVDGARQDFVSGHKGRLFLDPILLDRVEVVRGPGSALYGSGALGGVMSFATKDADDLLRPGERVGVRIAPSYSGGNEERGAFGTLFGRSGAVDYVGGFSFRDADDAKLSTGIDLPFSAYETWGALGKIGWNATESQRFEVSYDRFDESSTTPLNANSIATEPSQVGDRSSLRETLRIGYELEPLTDERLSVRVNAYRSRTNVEETRLSDRRHDLRELTTWGLDATGTSRFAVLDGVRTGLTYGF